jgi:hypothetical protein
VIAARGPAFLFPCSQPGWDSLAAVVQVTCPFCGHGYVHAGGEDAFSENTNIGTSPLGNRGPWTALPAWCEGCDEPWLVVVRVHKGRTFIGAVRDGSLDRWTH